MGCRYHAETRYRDDLQAAGLTDAHAVLDFARRGTVVSNASSLMVRHHALAGYGTYAKLYFYGPLNLRRFLRPSRAQTEYRSYACLRRLGLRVPEVICFAERRLLGCVRWAVIVTREVAGAANLVEVFSRMPDDTARRAALLQQLAGAVAQMHNGGFYHRSLRFRNVLLQPPDAGAATLYFIDSPNGRAWSVTPVRDSLSDLGVLCRDFLSLCHPLEWDLFRDHYGARRSPDLRPHLERIPETCRRRYGAPLAAR
jgi:tRNA A-37 threonylcarbamoyl transferase component Bud32